MDWARELFTILFVCALALASGVQIGWGIHHLRQRDFVVTSYVTRKCKASLVKTQHT